MRLICLGATVHSVLFCDQDQSQAMADLMLSPQMQLPRAKQRSRTARQAWRVAA